MLLCELNEQQRAIFEQFAAAVQDCKLPESSDAYLLKWLVARNFDIDAAENMLRACLEWRQTFEVDRVLDSQPKEVFSKYFPMAISGTDKFGGPIWISRYGQLDLAGLIHCVTKREYLRQMTCYAETALKEMRGLSTKFGRDITSETFIIDLEHINMRDLLQKKVMDLGIETTKISEAYYPEILRKVFLINAPSLITFVVSVMKPFMSPVTFEKVQIFGTDSNQWKAALLECIEPDQLPAMYGGTMTDPDGNPQCLSKMVAGGPIPKSYYLTNKKPVASSDMESLVISKGSKKKFEFHVENPGCALRWKFISYEGDIGFHIYYKKNTKDVDVIPWDRVDSHIAEESGQIICIHRCAYIVVFDNSFSYWRSKKLSYSLSLQDVENGN